MNLCVMQGLPVRLSIFGSQVVALAIPIHVPYALATTFYSFSWRIPSNVMHRSLNTISLHGLKSISPFIWSSVW